jgi:Domain of unknown function (DUF4194)
MNCPDSATETKLYNSDLGDLPLDTRRVLVQLLSGPSLDGRRHGKLWPVLLRDEAVVRRSLSNLFLDLIVDRDLEVAYTRQADTEDLDTPKLLRNVKLTFADSILLLNLRQRLTHADYRGERAVVSEQEIMDDLGVFERAENTDRFGFIKRIRASIKKLVLRSILQKVRESDDRFEISPTLKLLFSAEVIESMSERYQTMINGDLVPGGSLMDGDENDEEEEADSE